MATDGDADDFVRKRAGEKTTSGVYL